MARGRIRADGDPSSGTGERSLRPAIVVSSGLVVFASTLIWAYLAVVVTSYGNDPVKLQICGESLPYTFLNVVAAVGLLAGASLIWSTLSYANSGKNARWFYLRTVVCKLSPKQTHFGIAKPVFTRPASA
jgi:hypothetical protein